MAGLHPCFIKILTTHYMFQKLCGNTISMGNQEWDIIYYLPGFFTLLVKKSRK